LIYLRVLKKQGYVKKTIDTFKYNFKNDTITVMGYIYAPNNQKNIPIKKDTQNYYFKTVGSTIMYPESRTTT